MKIAQLYILSLLILLGSVALQTKPKQKEKNLLRFDGIYVYDNGIDTIIKDYELSQKIKNMGVFEFAGFYDIPDTGWTTVSGSRSIECLRFCPSDTLIHTSSIKKFDYKSSLKYLKNYTKSQVKTIK